MINRRSQEIAKKPQLADLGWSSFFEEQWQNKSLGSLLPARVTADFGNKYKIALPGEGVAELSGALRHQADVATLPKVGDWVGVRKSGDSLHVIELVLDRKTEIARKYPGANRQKQVIVANVDKAFVIQSADEDFSISRLSRYLFQLSRDKITPIIILNKIDLADNVDEFVAQISDAYPSIPILTTVATDQKGIETILGHIPRGATAVLLGSSGVGKSTITNQLLGKNIQRIQPVREVDSKGRHTTVHRELFILPNGGMLIDTPGLRELQIWGSVEDLQYLFRDIESLASQCRFKNCSHTTEPDCAIQLALSKGTLRRRRYENYIRLKEEISS